MRPIKRSPTVVAAACFAVGLVLSGLPAWAGSGPGGLANVGSRSSGDRADLAATASPTTVVDSDIRFVFAGYLLRFNFLSSRVTPRPIAVLGFDRVELSRPRADNGLRTVRTRARRGFYDGGTLRYRTADLRQAGRRVPLEPE